MSNTKHYGEENHLLTELTLEETAEVNGGGWLGAAIGLVAGAAGGFVLGGPVGAIGGGFLGAFAGHAIEEGEYCSGGAAPQGDCENL